MASNKRSKRIYRTMRLAGLCLLYALNAKCARIDSEDSRSTALAYQVGVPVASLADNAADQSIYGSKPAAPFDLTKAAGFPISSVATPTAFVSQQPSGTLGPVTKAWSNSPSQKWLYDRGFLSTDGKTCLNLSAGGQLVMGSCSASQQAVAYTYIPLLNYLYRANATFDTSLLLTAGDANAPLGQALEMLTPDAAGNASWYLYDNQPGALGSPIMYQGDAKRCLGTQGGVASLASCSGSKDQRWQFTPGTVQNMQGSCLACDVNHRQLLVTNCNDSLAFLSFYLSPPVGLTCLLQSANERVVPALDARGARLFLRPKTINETSFWTIGGPAFALP